MPDLLPSLDLRVVPDSWRTRKVAGLGGNEGRLGDEERAGNACALLVELDEEVRRNVVRVCTHPRLGPEHNAVGERDVTDFDRAEECGGGCGRHRSTKDLGGEELAVDARGMKVAFIGPGA